MARKQKESLDYTMERQRGMIDELVKCCGEYPSPRERKSDGARRVVCKKCDNSTPYYISAGLSANRGWNEKRQLQIKVQEIPDIKYPRFGEVVHE